MQDRRWIWIAAIGIAVSYLAVALWLAPDYGPTWDCVKGEYKWGESILAYLASGERDLLDRTFERFELTHRQPHPDFRGIGFPWYEFWPLSAMLSSASEQIFWTRLGWIPPLVAYNLVIMVFVALLALVMVRFFGRRLGLTVGVAAALFMLLSPRFFAHSFNNMRDMPEACLYSFTVMAGYLALTRTRLRWWALAGALAGLALAQKPNALFLPVQMSVFLVLALIYQRIYKKKDIHWSWRGLVLSAGTFLAVFFAASPTFWDDTWERLKVQFGFILRRGNVLLDSTAPEAGSSALLSMDGFLLAIWTTPPVILILAFVGVVAPRCPALMRIFLLTWVAVPVGRVSLPGMLNFDGIRHFLEFYPALCTLASLGLVTILDYTTLRVKKAYLQRTAHLLVWIAAMAPCAAVTATLNPNSICYFNCYVGGLSGLQARGIPYATDYWGNSYWQGLAWLNDHAEEGAHLLVPVAGHIVASAAPVRLRPDIRLCGRGDQGVEAPFYVMYITRKGWYGDLVRELERSSMPVHEITAQGGIILRIHRIADPEDARTKFDLWRAFRGKLALHRLVNWIARHPEKKQEFLEIKKTFEAGKAETVRERLESILPSHVRGLYPELFWYLERKYSK